MDDQSLLSIVAPVYNESEGIEAFYDRVARVAESLDGFDCEFIFVDDGSQDESYEALLDIAEIDDRVGLLKFSRNFGHQIAITAGLDHARGDCVVIIDSDLQDPPELIPEMIAKWKEGFDVVYAVREQRNGEGRFKLWTASLFYRLLSRLTTVDIPVDTGDFRLLSRRAADHLREFRETDRFVRGLVSWVGFRQTGVSYSRDPRYAGETKYPYRKMLKFAVDGITSFSTLPLRLATWLGYATSALAFLYLLTVFVQKWMGITVSGWPTIMVAMLFLGGVQLICVGIVGEYVGRIFTQIKGRPMYIIEEEHSVPSARAGRKHRPGTGVRVLENGPQASRPALKS